MADVDTLITASSIEIMHHRIAPHVRRTPVVATNGRDFGLAAFPLTFKLELLQHAGSFKTRGAFAHLLTREIPEASVAAASGGNHGVAVAYAAAQLGVKARVFVPSISSPAKIAAIRAWGADLTIVGERYADALEASDRWAFEHGAISVHAFDQPETLLGQGTVGRELSAQVELDTVLVAVGGGGLIGGVAAWYSGGARVIGVEPEAAPTLSHALAAGKPVDAPAGGVAADSLAPRRIGTLMFPIAQAYVHSVRLVADRDIVAAQRVLWERLRIVAEPGGAAAFAALISGAYTPAPGERVGLVISGGNSNAVAFA